jgi:hypothetical protein
MASILIGFIWSEYHYYYPHIYVYRDVRIEGHSFLSCMHIHTLVNQHHHSFEHHSTISYTIFRCYDYQPKAIYYTYINRQINRLKNLSFLIWSFLFTISNVRKSIFYLLFDNSMRNNVFKNVLFHACIHIYSFGIIFVIGKNTLLTMMCHIHQKQYFYYEL